MPRERKRQIVEKGLFANVVASTEPLLYSVAEEVAVVEVELHSSK